MADLIKVDVVKAELVQEQEVKLFPSPAPDLSWQAAAEKFNSRVQKRRKL